MENFFERRDGMIRQKVIGLGKKSRHFPLPTFVDLALGHARASAPKVIRLQVANE
jgi:hypothetical protein